VTVGDGRRHWENKFHIYRTDTQQKKLSELLDVAGHPVARRAS
jgi:hypothetical protein